MTFKKQLFFILASIAIISTSSSVVYADSNSGQGPQGPWQNYGGSNSGQGPQGPWQNYGQVMQNATHAANGIYPCFGQGMNQTGYGMHHFGQHGNQTGFRMHRFGQNGTHTAYPRHPCFGQNVTQGGYGMSVPQKQIPSWVRNNAKWWSQNQLNDSDFVNGIQYLMQQGMMKIPPTPSSLTPSSTTSSPQIPSWIKSNAAWWAQGQISDDDFVKSLQYLVSARIIKV